jgi:hypothetical protein
LYDFNAALAACREAKPMTVTNAFRVDDAHYFRSLRSIDKQGRSTLLAIPDGDALHKHAFRFDTELVNETAKLLGVDTSVKRAPKAAPRQRRTNEDLTAQVLELRDRNHLPATIADTLNVSDRRVTAILRDAALPFEGEQAA